MKQLPDPIVGSINLHESKIKTANHECNSLSNSNTSPSLYAKRYTIRIECSRNLGQIFKYHTNNI